MKINWKEERESLEEYIALLVLALLVGIAGGVCFTP
jgi:hypothetical protein